MLIAKGYAARFLLAGGRSAKPPASYAMLHDPSGKDWASCSGLFMPFSKDGEDIEDKEASSYFGHDPKGGSMHLPPRSLSSWTRVGLVEEIEYSRRRPGRLEASHRGDYFHPFESKPPTLYRLGRVYRLELGPGCEWNWRGIVRP